ncbi:MAG: type IV secretion system DNA-binding domain-containing protein [Tannerella sp.]|nr:type IV secretion system DNA-binding domain-containing protein [Tannerella sp.]
MDGEAPELKKMHEFLRAAIYFLLFLEIIVFVHLDYGSRWNPIVVPISRLFSNIFYSKLFILLIIIFTCTGTLAKKNLELNPIQHIGLPVFLGLMLFFGSAFFATAGKKLYDSLSWTDYVYIGTAIAGTILLNVGFDNISKFVQHNLMKDRFNLENESFEQTTKLVETSYSVNLPMSFYYRKRRHKGWINIVNPFRGTLIIGTPGSGKSFTFVHSYIRQMSAKGFCLAVYDFKFPELARLTYYQFLKNKQKGILPVNAQFNVVNFQTVEKSVRFNPIKHEYIPTLAAALETSQALIEALKKGTGTAEGGGNEQFFTQSAVNFVAAVFYFFSKYKKGKYSDLPHAIAFMNGSYDDIFSVLYTCQELHSILSPFRMAYLNKASDQLEGQIGSAKVQISRLATKESFWVLTEDLHKEPINLKISDKDNPGYIIIANSPETQEINSALNALMLNRLVRLINSKGNLPSAIIIDELPTLYFHKIANLLSTARSNKVAVVLALQELPQLKATYNRNGAEEICAVIGNIIAGSARNKETLDWLEKIFGKVKQLKTNVSIDRNRQTVSLNENMDFLMPASKIAALQTSEFVGQIALDFGITEEDIENTMFHCRTELDIDAIQREEKNYFETPVYYKFESEDSKNKILMDHFERICEETKNLIVEIIAESDDNN